MQGRLIRCNKREDQHDAHQGAGARRTHSLPRVAALPFSTIVEKAGNNWIVDKPKKACMAATGQ